MTPDVMSLFISDKQENEKGYNVLTMTLRCTDYKQIELSSKGVSQQGGPRGANTEGMESYFSIYGMSYCILCCCMVKYNIVRYVSSNSVTVVIIRSQGTFFINYQEFNSVPMTEFVLQPKTRHLLYMS